MSRSSGSTTAPEASGNEYTNFAAFSTLIASRRPILICFGFCGSNAASVPRRDEAAQRLPRDFGWTLLKIDGDNVLPTEHVEEGVRGADFVATDVWVSMGEPKEVWAERIGALVPYAVTMDVLRATGNPDVKFLHCLPAFHNREPTMGQQIFETYGLDGLEVTDDVFLALTGRGATPEEPSENGAQPKGRRARKGAV